VVLAVHDELPRGLPPAVDELGWREALAKRAARVEADEIMSDGAGWRIPTDFES
jgi:hypothetical protein